MTKKKKFSTKLTSGKLFTANFGGCKVSQSLHISRTDCPHRRQMLPSLLPTPHVVDRPLEFLSEGNKHIASWSKAEG